MQALFLDWNFFELHQKFSDLSNDAKAKNHQLTLLGRKALDALLQKHQLDLTLDFNQEYGFPFLKDSNGRVSKSFFCSISHTEGAAVAVLSCSPVGIDIEKKNRSVQRVLKRIAAPDEIKNLSESTYALKSHLLDPSLLLWTGKEALSKAIGVGLRKGLLPFQIDFKSKTPFTAKLLIKGPNELSQPRISYYERNDYLICLAFEI
jgi:phosphopantetheinyl transferase